MFSMKHLPKIISISRKHSEPWSSRSLPDRKDLIAKYSEKLEKLKRVEMPSLIMLIEELPEAPRELF